MSALLEVPEPKILFPQDHWLDIQTLNHCLTLFETKPAACDPWPVSELGPNIAQVFRQRIGESTWSSAVEFEKMARRPLVSRQSQRVIATAR